MVNEIGSVSCFDTVGFAAIGTGNWHANSQFMLLGYSIQRPLSETLLLTYIAKKRAEVAPGVGNATDMFLIKGLGGLLTLSNTEVINELEKSFLSLQTEEQAILDKVRGKMRSYLDDLATRSQVAQPSFQSSTEE